MFARDEDGGMPLQEVVEKYKPTMLLGMTGVGGLFKEKVIKEMAKHCDRPVIFPLSNPTIKAECTATQAFEWTEGRCIFASGSPFDAVKINEQVFYPTQCNNSKSISFFDFSIDFCGNILTIFLFSLSKCTSSLVLDLALHLQVRNE